MAREATTHISLTPDARDMIRDFSRGLGVDYSTAIRRLLHEAARVNEAPIQTGVRLREKQNAVRPD